ncbi:MAG: hypothetical protein ACKO86_28590, partial [Dolichospermum sp.]
MNFIFRLFLLLPMSFYLLPIVSNLGVTESAIFANAQSLEGLQLSQNQTILPKSISQAVLRDVSERS